MSSGWVASRILQIAHGMTRFFPGMQDPANSTDENGVGDDDAVS